MTKARASLSNRERALRIIARSRGWDIPAGMKSCVVPIRGVVNDAMASEVECRLADNVCRLPVELVIDSFGGYVHAAEKIVQTIRLRSTGSVLARVTGAACSAATVILMTADVRVARPTARVLVHEAAAMDKNVRWTAARHRRMAAVLDNTNKMLLDTYVAATGWPREWFEHELKTEEPMTVQRAIAIGLLHGLDSDLVWLNGRPSVAPANDYRISGRANIDHMPIAARSSYEWANWLASTSIATW